MSEIEQLNDAIALYRNNQLDKAESALNQLLTNTSIEETCQYYLGLIQIARSNFSSAINHLNQALKKNPHKSEYLFNKAISLGQLGDYQECLNLLGIVEKSLPQSLTVLFNKAVALSKLGQKNTELLIYKKILSIDPANIDALNNIAVCSNELGQAEQALNYINFLLSLHPTHSTALKTKSDILQKKGLLNDSFECLHKYLNISHKNQLISEQIYHFCLKLIGLIKIPSNYASEKEIDEVRTKVAESIKESLLLVNEITILSDEEFEVISSILLRLNLFYLAYQQKNDREINEAFCSIIEKVLGHKIDEFEAPSKSSQKSKIKLGVLSRFKYHVDTDILSWIKQLPSNDYELVFIRLNGEPTNYYADELKNLGTLIDLQLDESNLPNVVTQIRTLKIDALFMQDIGMTSDGKFMANIRFAPLQFTNWSHPVTSGSTKVDYYLSSELMEPEDAQEHYTETLIRLPNLGLYIPSYKFDANKLGSELDKNKFNIGCLQSLFKYLPQDDDVFIEICKNIPQAQLIFIEDVTQESTKFFTNRLKTIFKTNNLDYSSFIKIFPRMSHEKFMSLMNETDIEIDSIGWTGGNTSLQALFLGKPILTIEGQYMRGRHTSAMLKLLDLQLFNAAKSKKEILEIGIQLNSDRSKLKEIQSEILKKSQILFSDKQQSIAIDGFIKSHL